MADAISIKGVFKIINKRFLSKKNPVDSFNTQSTVALFKKILLNEMSDMLLSLLPINPDIIKEDSRAETLSLYYWTIKISKEFIQCK